MKVKNYLFPALAIVVVFGGSAVAQAGDAEKPAVVSAVAPLYPALAVAAGATGDVTVEVEIDKEGKVVAVNSNSTGKMKLLARASDEAARRWRFAPSESGEKGRQARLVFTFVFIPKDTPFPDTTPIFRPPYRVEVRTVEENLAIR